ncbi:DNA polymerase III subunit gamma/tau [Hoeflea sp. YIM 152468]|uniref:DNA polymerase III subunit gamma/tau n=1 Tax=Hoeflea sp. YIM 152468 TaxID=3031759 RepID=UPI0023DC1EB2|nr:DNA polymerase III subunit gamma/tau [Hoeflea sp. YIM 152468]MDF1610341.1 DNA polymerase III subunit gamma/tau [Hoeflea sp. YIM 152468]
MDEATGTNTASHAVAAEGQVPYRVLARKYRPKDFTDLIGQAPMVRTLTNAFSTGRIAQAWMLTGVRGVGKTTTARILARALNYQTAEIDRPTIDLTVSGEHCQAIMEGRHVDVIEMDAASHTGIDDIREIIEQVRYRPVAARYKVYIIDEVHMLSNQAFNGLLKTLEEPPAHVKFIFATTEIRKVPITVLSRCQRFDLRRIDSALLVAHFKSIADQEGIVIDEESLAMIARAAEGSVRDGLSLLDQAIAHGGGGVDAGAVRSMLGLADRSRIVELFGALMTGDVAAALANFRDQYDSGASPSVVLTDLADFTHLVTRLKFVPEAGEDPSLTQTERESGADYAAKLSTVVLSRVWQMLLKGITETDTSSRQAAAAEMTLIRIAHAANLPSPEDAVKALQTSGGASAGAGGQPAGNGPSGGGAMARAVGDRSMPQGGGGQPSMRLAHSAEPSVVSPAVAEPVEEIVIGSLEDMVALAEKFRDIAMKVQIRTGVRLVRIEPGRLEINLAPDASPSLPGELIKKLGDWTGAKWTVALSREEGAPTLAERETAKREALVSDARQDPDIAAILARFPGARITDVRIAATEEILAGDVLSPSDEGDILPDDIEPGDETD